ncbi:MAG: hypothetical protein JXB47_13310, partial [Anaerolineae bacterium]|nr:hypothetical protein [Anaerolineae bacterium]
PLEGEGSGERGKKALKLMHMGGFANPPLHMAMRPPMGTKRRKKSDTTLSCGATARPGAPFFILG